MQYVFSSPVDLWFSWLHFSPETEEGKEINLYQVLILMLHCTGMHPLAQMSVWIYFRCSMLPLLGLVGSPTSQSGLFLGTELGKLAILRCYQIDWHVELAWIRNQSSRRSNKVKYFELMIYTITRWFFWRIACVLEGISPSSKQTGDRKSHKNWRLWGLFGSQK